MLGVALCQQRIAKSTGRKGDKKGPLAKLIRQLRFGWEDFKLAEQNQQVSIPIAMWLATARISSKSVE